MQYNSLLHGIAEDKHKFDKFHYTNALGHQTVSNSIFQLGLKRITQILLTPYLTIQPLFTYTRKTNLSAIWQISLGFNQIWCKKLEL